ncbi:MAG: C45 family peptidase [Candidatus Eisenbacteria bacterium]
MKARRAWIRSVFFSALLAAAAWSLCCSPDKDGGGAERSAGGIEFREEIVAGGPDDFMEVRHIVLRGSNFEIGRKLAEIARERHGAGPIPSRAPEETRAQREYFEAHYPVLVERMRGAAAAFGLDLREDGWNLSGLLYGFRFGGCSVVFYPPGTSETGRGVLSRNFDFTTGTFLGEKPREGELPACARPYVVEMHPDKGHASLAICSFDLLTGVMDGINSEGLAVAILGDNDVISEVGMSPTRGAHAGFNETQILRCILDTCADVEEAKRLLRDADLYYNTAPYHYIVADRHGDAFIWENAPGMEEGFTVESPGEPLVTTNFLLHRYPDPSGLPEEAEPLGWFNRYREIKRRLDETAPPYDLAFIRETNRCVSFDGEQPEIEPYPPGATMWHALYHPVELRAEVDFYLGRDADGAVRRSGSVALALE